VATGALAAAVSLSFGAGAGDIALVVSASSEGVWGNLVRLDVDYDSSNPDSTFNLAVTRYELRNTIPIPLEREQHRNLSMNSRSSTYAPSVVNAASKLITLTRPTSIAFSDRGWSLSGDLSGFAGTTAQETTITGILDGNDPFTLVLTAPFPTNLATLRTRLSAAIDAAGLGGANPRLEAVRADALGADVAAGNHIKLRSLVVTSNPNTAAEFSSVQIIPAPVDDATAMLKLGLARGGREKEGASTRRPLQNGTVSGDQADILGNNVSGQLTVVINDVSTGTATGVFTSSALTLPATPVGLGLAQQLQTLIRSVAHPATSQATVTFAGTRLRIVPSAVLPNIAISFTGAGATAALLTTAKGAVMNPQQYSLGTGAVFGAQSTPVPGSDGTPPSVPSEITGNYAAKTGIYALRDVDLFNLLAIPRTASLPDPQALDVLSKAIAFCEERRAFYLVDPPPSKGLNDIGAWAASASTSKNSAVYFPRVLIPNPLDGSRLGEMAASGTLAGVFARTDAERGIWKAPAGIDAVLRGVQGFSRTLTDPENGTLNPLGVNCLRSFPAYGRVAWGARTMQGDDRQASEWKYIPVRRLALYLEESLYRGTKWVVFEPNDEPLWAQIRLNVGAFMHGLFRQGAFQGASPREAYLVKCDKETTTQNDINLGIVNIVVGFAPLKPAEFVVIKIQQLAGQVQV
jgi:hypothetical protein